MLVGGAPVGGTLTQKLREGQASTGIDFIAGVFNRGTLSGVLRRAGL